MPQRVIDALEQVDVAQDQGEATPIARGTLDLTRKMLAEEAAAGHPSEIVRRRKLAIFSGRPAQDCSQSGDAPRRGQARIELPLAHATCHALIGSRREPGGAIRRLIELRYVEHERRPVGGARAQTPYQLQTIGDY